MDWNLVLDERFVTLDAWNTWNNMVFLETNVQTTQVTLNNGLVITATDTLIGGKYPSGLIESKTAYTYGYFECRCQIPTGIGIFPAFWLYDKDNSPLLPEIDIFEYIGTGKTWHTTHANGLQNSSQQAQDDTAMTTGYHTFAARWDAEHVSFYMDNRFLVRTSTFVPTVPLKIMLDLFVGNFETGVIDATFPRQFLVDYVKVWQRR